MPAHKENWSEDTKVTLPEYYHAQETRGILLAVLFYQVVLKLNIIATAAKIEDWKHVENHASHYSDRNQGAEHYIPTRGSYTTSAQESTHSLPSLAHAAQKLWKRWRCSRPMQTSLTALWIRLKNTHSQHTGSSHGNKQAQQQWRKGLHCKYELFPRTVHNLSVPSNRDHCG